METPRKKTKDITISTPSKPITNVRDTPKRKRDVPPKEEVASPKSKRTRVKKEPSQRVMAAEELLTTEQSYVGHLNLLITVPFFSIFSPSCSFSSFPNVLSFPSFFQSKFLCFFSKLFLSLSHLSYRFLLVCNFLIFFKAFQRTTYKKST